MNDKEINNASAGPELDMLIEVEIFGSTPLTDDEWEMCKAYIEYREPAMPPPDSRMIKMPLAEPSHTMKLPFRLIWPRWFSRESFGDQSLYLVEKMRYDGWLFDLSDFDNAEEDGKIIKLAGFQKGVVRGEATGETDALAIARAALIAVREWKKAELIRE